MEVDKLVTPSSRVHSPPSSISTRQRAGITGSDSYNAAPPPTTIHAHLQDEGLLFPRDSPLIMPPCTITMPGSFKTECEEAAFHECKDLLECVVKHKPYRAEHTKKMGAWQAVLEELQAQQPSRCVGRGPKWLTKRVKDLVDFVENGEFHEMVNAALGKKEKRKFNLYAGSVSALHLHNCGRGLMGVDRCVVWRIVLTGWLPT
jgi:hypothetical protein